VWEKLAGTALFKVTALIYVDTGQQHELREFGTKVVLRPNTCFLNCGKIRQSKQRGVTTRVRNLMCFFEEGRNYGGGGSLRALCKRHSFGTTLEGRTYNHTLPQIKITSHRKLKVT
jgi:hypothetical protein